MTDSDHIMQLRQQVANLHGSLVKAQAERDEERRKLRKAEIECSMLRVECGVISATLDDVRRERDEARRQVCELVVEGGCVTVEQIALERCWDCYKEPA
jgi:chromosome segregation ATPase